ncbi:MAG: polysaccharide deacetylase family protein [Bacteroidota bacterium]
MVKNFLFHRVSPERDVLWDPMDVKLFDKCIRYISRNYDVVTIESLPRLSPGKKYATISFDDGYKDNIIYALPILETYGVKASFYIVTDCINNNIPTWTYILDYLFNHTRKIKIHLDFDFINKEFRENNIDTSAARITIVKKLKPALKILNHDQRTLVLNEVISVLNDVTIPDLMMSWNDLEILKSKGHLVGSHTVSHCMLGTMTDETQIEYELKASALEIEKRLGFFPDTISYPVGSYNDTTIRLSKAVGYKIGLAVNQDVFIPQRDSVYEIPRIELYNESWFKTKLRISHTLEHIKKIVKYR